MSRAGPGCSRLLRGSAWPALALASGLLVGALLGLGPPAVSETGDLFRALDLLRPRQSEPAKDFRAAASSGGSIGLADHHGEMVLLNFWATLVPAVQGRDAGLYRRYRDRGFAVLAVSLDANVALVPPFVRKHGLSFRIALDHPRAAIAGRYGVTALLATFLIDRSGEVRAIAFGPRDWDSAPAHAVIEALAASSLAPTGPPGTSPLSK